VAAASATFGICSTAPTVLVTFLSFPSDASLPAFRISSKPSFIRRPRHAAGLAALNSRVLRPAHAAMHASLVPAPQHIFLRDSPSFYFVLGGKNRLPVLLAADGPRPAARPRPPARALLMILASSIPRGVGLTIRQGSARSPCDYYPSCTSAVSTSRPDSGRRRAVGAGGEIVSVIMLAALGVPVAMRAADKEERRGSTAKLRS